MTVIHLINFLISLFKIYYPCYPPITPLRLGPGPGQVQILKQITWPRIYFPQLQLSNRLTYVPVRMARGSVATPVYNRYINLAAINWLPKPCIISARPEKAHSITSSRGKSSAAFSVNAMGG